MTRTPVVRIGTAGWSVSALSDLFPGKGSHLTRYASQLTAAEINTSFYRPHRRTTYARWAGSVSDGFAFAVKAPRTMTHERRLAACADLIARFADEVGGLGEALGVLLVQLPPSLAFEPAVAAAFFATLRAALDVPLACEPRHLSWFTPSAEALLTEHRVARVAADPAVAPGAGQPGGWPGLVYLRLHGAPRIYHSDYPPAVLAETARAVEVHSRHAAVWCIFDNTAQGHALSNALALSRECAFAHSEGRIRCREDSA